MKQTPLTNMEGRYITQATKEEFDALVAMGYESVSTNFKKDKKYLEVLDFGEDAEIYQVDELEEDSKQAYYHKGHFYDKPYEENKENKMSQIEKEFLAEECGEDESRVHNSFPVEELTITEEKVPFPERMEDVEEFTEPKWLIKLVWSFGAFVDGKSIREVEYENLKIAYENGVDVKWKLKPKIDRRLHKNRPLALAIGRWIDKNDGIEIYDGVFLNMVSATGRWFSIYKQPLGNSVEEEAVLPDYYIFPAQVIEWMHEYAKEEQ